MSISWVVNITTLTDTSTSLPFNSRFPTHYFVLCHLFQCGRPLVVSKCAECGIQIGGLQHNPVDGFSLVTGGVTDQTRPGHILGEARQRSEAPNRQMTSVQSCLLRLLTHLAMLLGAAQDPQVGER